MLLPLSAADSRKLCPDFVVKSLQAVLSSWNLLREDTLHCRNLELYLDTLLSLEITHVHTHRMKQGECTVSKPAQQDDRCYNILKWKEKVHTRYFHGQGSCFSDFMLRNGDVSSIIAGLWRVHLIHQKRLHADRGHRRNAGEAFRRVAIGPIREEGRMGLRGYNNGGNRSCQLLVLSLIWDLTRLRDRGKIVSLYVYLKQLFWPSFKFHFKTDWWYRNKTAGGNVRCINEKHRRNCCQGIDKWLNTFYTSQDEWSSIRTRALI